jgi:hypothetical protein
MGVDPDFIERAQTSRVRRWLHFWDEQTAYETYKAQEAAWRMSGGAERVH